MNFMSAKTSDDLQLGVSSPSSKPLGSELFKDSTVERLFQFPVTVTISHSSEQLTFLDYLNAEVGSVRGGRSEQLYSTPDVVHPLFHHLLKDAHSHERSWM